MRLRLDVDAPRRPLTLGTLAMLCRRAGYRPVWLLQQRSPGGTGWHLECCLSPEPKSAMEVAALQAVLGSDRAREACNVGRARLVDGKRIPRWWRERFNVLYG